MLGIAVERRNVGAALNPYGQMVRFGSPGDSDLCGVLPDGRALAVEIKHEGFDPSKLRGAKREHFERQLAKLKRTNELGGVGVWVDDAAEFLAIMREVLVGASVDEPGYGRPVVYRRGADE